MTSMKAPLYNWKGDRVGELELSEITFGVRWNSILVHQALAAQVANRRKPLAHAKNRSEVSGGGKKPWRQKGTGRARHGSIRSPIWKGGGVTHGPRKDRIFAVKLNRKMLQGAIRSILSRKLKDGEVRVLDSLSISAPKTKELFRALHGFLQAPRRTEKLSTLLIPSSANKTVFRASANIPSVKALNAASLNVEDLLKYRHILFDQDAIAELKV